ncbi:MAG: alpha-glucosidase/alpha-galactosidase [Bacilli bacterium]|nr:alpha-glucosidase/alpha-galactosidase [Bacilli bacterium]
MKVVSWKMDIKIAYIGGGSKEWARVFINDLALALDISGEVWLYDIDKEAAMQNESIGNKVRDNEKAISKWNYKVATTIEEALNNADFVAISILPGLMEAMKVDVHYPEKYGIYQSVGDTVGPGGVIRSLRTVPMFEFFAKKIKNNCPNAWVINFTNPMSICVKTLYDVFPEIKAFGCCHEVFHTQSFLCDVLREQTGIIASRSEIFTEVAGINHFTWISRANYGRINIMELLPGFLDKYYDEGYERHGKTDSYKTNPFASANRIKMDLYKRYGILAAAGDRHLAEFMSINDYLFSENVASSWKFALTKVDYRLEQRNRRISETKAMAAGEIPIRISKSSEEAVDLIRAILGKTTKLSNVNIINKGQMPGINHGCIVETNAVFSNDRVVPVLSERLPKAVLELLKNHIDNIEMLYKGIKNRNFETIFTAFKKQPLCDNLSDSQKIDLFIEMVEGTKEYLENDYDFQQLSLLKAGI